MKKRLSSILLVLGILTLNAVPVRAFNRINPAKESVLMLQGRWCFEFTQLGLLCFDF